MSKKLLVCDLDDVLWDMVPTWCRRFNSISSTTVAPEDFTSWDIGDTVGEDNAEIFYSILREDDFWDEVIANQQEDILNETYNSLEWLMANYNVYITTATHYRNAHKLDLFLELFDCVPVERLVLINDKWIIDADIVIDDNPEILVEFEKLGKRCVKIEKPWNAWLECESYPHFISAVNKLKGEV